MSYKGRGGGHTGSQVSLASTSDWAELRPQPRSTCEPVINPLYIQPHTHNPQLNPAFPINPTSDFRDFFKGPQTDKVYSPSPGAEAEEYHAVLLVGYSTKGRYWIARNSWGPKWNGDGSFNVCACVGGWLMAGACQVRHRGHQLALQLLVTGRLRGGRRLAAGQLRLAVLGDWGQVATTPPCDPHRHRSASPSATACL